MPVAVPGDRVLAVAVEVEADRVEILAIARAERAAHVGEQRQRLGRRRCVSLHQATRRGSSTSESNMRTLRRCRHGSERWSSSNTSSAPRNQPGAKSIQLASSSVRALDGVERGVELRRQTPEQRALQEHVFDVRAGRPAVKPAPRRDRQHWSGAASRSTMRPTHGWPTTSTSPTSPPASGARATSSSSPRARWRSNGCSSRITTCVRSSSRCRSTNGWLRSSTGSPQPVYVAATDVLKATVGFDIHRGAVASADRRPLPSLDSPAPDRPAHRRARGAQRPREPRRDRPIGAGLRDRRAGARPDVHRPVLPPDRTREHGRDPVPPRRQGHELEGRARDDPRRRLRGVGADPATETRPISGRCRSRTGWHSCWVPKDLV